MRIADEDERDWYMREAALEGWSVRTLIRYDEVDYMKELLSDPHDETEYWAARFFHDVIPELTEATAQSLVDNCDKPVIVANAKRLLVQPCR